MESYSDTTCIAQGETAVLRMCVYAALATAGAGVSMWMPSHM